MTQVQGSQNLCLVLGVSEASAFCTEEHARTLTAELLQPRRCLQGGATP